MTKGKIRREVVTQRILWVREMLAGIRALPTRTKEEFLRKRHHVAAAESYLRRALEALFDLGRHVLAKGFGLPYTEYKEVARGLQETGVLDGQPAQLIERMAGYRNRMVHFYHELTADELYEICHDHLGEIEQVLDAMVEWCRREDVGGNRVD